MIARRFDPWLALLAVLFAAQATPASEDSPEAIKFFEAQVRPLLIEHCHECHAAEKQENSLRLDSRAAVLKGGDSGAGIVPGKPNESRIIAAVNFDGEFEMPPDGKLSAKQIATIARWIELGAPWPNDKPASDVAKQGYDWEAAREHWAFRPVAKPSLPPVQDATWPQTGVDLFVLARLEANAMQPAAKAARITLIRRVYFDLLGLPPTPDEVDAFVADARPDAFARLVDRLLASPHYGERWGRHWLDVARYSDGHGGFLDNAPLPDAWRYRDWVVRSFNRDLPYDQFVRHQIAGDLVNDEDSLYGSGFFAIGPSYHSDGGDPDSVAQAKSETLDDRVDTLSRGFLALTAACARCHDHKFDPIPTLDYYSLAGVFNNTTTAKLPLVPPAVVDAYNAAQQQIKDLEAKLKKRNGELTANGRKPTEAEQQELDELRASLEAAKQAAPPVFPSTHALRDTGAADMTVALRGNLRKPGPVAPRRTLQILTRAERKPFSNGSGRLELAEAIASADNPLTTRVIVNRVWLHHFGQAIVRSPSNFGTLGEKPTHPLLLDWLAAIFVESGWSIKQLHRTIMLSSTYQMSSRFDEANFARDGDNRLFWRMNSRRMDVETWRDSLLFVTGELRPRSGGKPTADVLASRRRTLYLSVSRNGDVFPSDEFLRLFDFPVPRATIANRTPSTVPQQFLFLMNSSFMVDRARALVARLDRTSADNAEWIRSVYQLLFSRVVNQSELELGLAFLANSPEAAELPMKVQYAQTLLSTNEFAHVR